MVVHVAVESWDAGYGAPLAPQQCDASADTDVTREVHPDQWAPRRPQVEASADVLFLDGIRRSDAMLWVTDERGTSAGLAASYAAGIVRCDGAATIERCEVRRALLSTASPEPIAVAGADYLPVAVASDEPQALSEALQGRMRDLEAQIVAEAPPADLIVVDGPLPGKSAPPQAIGYIKTHHTRYLPPLVGDVVPALRPGERTPLLVTPGRYGRWSWYVRLPGGSGHPWAGVVRCEASTDLTLEQAVHRADVATATVIQFASQAHKDGRAPQNLYPIAGLERHLRRMLGAPEYCYRQLRRATHSPSGAGV